MEWSVLMSTGIVTISYASIQHFNLVKDGTNRLLRDIPIIATLEENKVRAYVLGGSYNFGEVNESHTVV